MDRSRIIKGRTGEQEAVDFLIGERYSIIGRNFRTCFGEIDIIAKNNGTIIFVEVKKRLNPTYGRPEEAVDFRKRGKIFKTALIYLKENNLYGQNLRFDIISINGKNGAVTTEHIKNAFQAPPKYYL